MEFRHHASPPPGAVHLRFPILPPQPSPPPILKTHRPLLALSFTSAATVSKPCEGEEGVSGVSTIPPPFSIPPLSHSTRPHAPARPCRRCRRAAFSCSFSISERSMPSRAATISDCNCRRSSACTASCLSRAWSGTGREKGGRGGRGGE